MGIHTEETRIERDTCTPIFTAALFTIARTWKQPRCPLADEWIRKLWYIYTKESIWISSNEVNETGAYYTEWSSQQEKYNTVYWHLYMEFRETVMMTLYARQQKRHRYKEQTFGLCLEKARVGWFERIALKHFY